MGHTQPMQPAARAALVVVLAAAACSLPTSSTAHDDPCHSARSCPSDDHSYVWSGMSCTSQLVRRLPEDQLPIEHRGVRYWCHVVTDQQMTPRPGSCTADRGSVRTLSDRRAGEVRPRVTATTVARLAALSRPATLGARGEGAESTRYRVRAQLVRGFTGQAGELRVVLADPADGSSIEARFPAAACTLRAHAADRRAIAAARRELLERFPALATGRPQRLHGTATVVGVGFFAPAGRAGENGFALAPVLGLAAG